MWFKSDIYIAVIIFVMYLGKKVKLLFFVRTKS